LYDLSLMSDVLLELSNLSLNLQNQKNNSHRSKFKY